MAPAQVGQLLGQFCLDPCRSGPAFIAATVQGFMEVKDLKTQEVHDAFAYLLQYNVLY